MTQANHNFPGDSLLSSAPDLSRGDILGRPEIERLVDRFYAQVRQDEMLGPVFDQVAKVDWTTHLPKLSDFWETVLFRTGGYKGNPLAVHLKLASETWLDWPVFERWLTLFHATIDELFAGENAGHLKRVASDMARVIHTRIATPADLRLPAIPSS